MLTYKKRRVSPHYKVVGCVATALAAINCDAHHLFSNSLMGVIFSFRNDKELRAKDPLKLYSPIRAAALNSTSLLND